METCRKTKLAIIECDIKSIHPYPGNPRKCENAIKPVANSIREFGFRQPIVVDKDMVIVVGHVRHQAAQAIGLKKVPVHVASDLTQSQIKALRIADNRAGEYSEWDLEKMRAELDEIVNSDFDFHELEMDIREILDAQHPSSMDVHADFAPVASSTQPRLDRRKRRICPECGHEFTA